MSTDQIPAEAFDVAQGAAVATWHVMATTGHRQAVDAAVRAAAPILLAAGRKQAADALLAAVNEPEQFYTNPHVSIMLVSQIFDVARAIAEGGEPNA